MGTKIVVTLSTMALFSCSSTAPIKKPSTEELGLLKNYALSMCITEEYKDGKVVEDAIKAMSGYREFSSAHLDAFPAVYQFYKSWDNGKTYGSKTGGTVELAKCIDFQQSSELKNFILNEVSFN